MATAREKFPMNPVYGETELYYRHAKGENLFILGPQSNPHKADWLRRQIEMFSYLGWRFLVLDMSPLGDMGAPHILGEHWTNIERNAVLRIAPPVIVRVPRFRDLMETLDEVNIMKSDNPAMRHVTVVYLGELRALTTEEKDALYGSLLKLHTYHHGVWLAVERFQTYPVEHLDLFQTQIVFGQDESDIETPKWIKQFNLGNVDTGELDEEEAYCLFRGKSEGAHQLLISNLSNARDW